MYNAEAADWSFSELPRMNHVFNSVIISYI